MTDPNKSEMPTSGFPHSGDTQSAHEFGFDLRREEDKQIWEQMPLDPDTIENVYLED